MTFSDKVVVIVTFSDKVIVIVIVIVTISILLSEQREGATVLVTLGSAVPDYYS